MKNTNTREKARPKCEAILRRMPAPTKKVMVNINKKK